METALQHIFEHFFYLGVEIAVSSHVLGLADWVSNLEICFHVARIVERVVVFLVENVLSSKIEQIDSFIFLVELIRVEM
jgi:hypothetical protein